MNIEKITHEHNFLKTHYHNVDYISFWYELCYKRSNIPTLKNRVFYNLRTPEKQGISQFS